MNLEEPGICSRPNVREDRQWFAMSAPYRRERIALERFEGYGIECFLPTREGMVRGRDGKKELKQVPVVPNLLFVRGTRSEIQSVKPRVGVAQYLTRREGESNVPITVPDRQMDNFRLAIEKSGSGTIYLQPSEVDLKKGTRVRIVGGMLDGLEGVFVKVKGSRSRRLVVMLEGITALAAEVEPDYIQVIKESENDSVMNPKV